jgi:RHS repeat-associated protein
MSALSSSGVISAGFLVFIPMMSSPHRHEANHSMLNVTVTPTPSWASEAAPNTTGHFGTFSVHNTGTQGDTYTLVCDPTSSNVTCTNVSPTILTLAAGASFNVTVTYDVGAVGLGWLKLNASGNFGTGNGKLNIPVGHTWVLTPDAGTSSTRTEGTNYTETFTLINIYGTSQTYTLTCGESINVTCSNVSPASVNLAAGAQTNLTATYTTGNPGTGLLMIRASGGTLSDTGTFNVPIVAPAGAPVVDLSPYDFDKQDYGRCAQNCFTVAYAQSTVPYFSMDAPRSVTLSYNGDRVSPRTFVNVNVRPDPNYAGSPTEYQLQVKVNGAQVTFVNGEQTLRFAYPGDTGRVRIGGEFYDSAYASTTSVNSLNILVSAKYGTTLITNSLVTKVTVVNEASSAIARGWTLAGIQRLYLQGDGSALVTDGGGGAVYFRKPSSKFISPTGEFSNLAAVGSTWVRSYPDSTKVTFDNTGKMISVKDRFSNQTSITYDGNGRVWKITDPMSQLITLSYGSNGLSTITDAAVPARVTTVTVDPNKRLTAIQDPDNISTLFGYDASNRLSTITNRNGKATTMGYDPNAGTLATVTAPSVTLYDGSSGSPVVSAAAWQKVGVPYVLTAGTAFNPPRADTVYGRVTEPGGSVTRFTVNHFGTAIQTTDPLGRVTTSTFDSNGLIVRTNFPNGGMDTASFNVTGLPTFVRQAGQSGTYFRYAAFGQVDSVWGSGQIAVRNFIGTNGRRDSTRLGNLSVTRYYYNQTGRVDSVMDPLAHLLSRKWYTGRFGNLNKDSVPGPQIRTIVYDAFGRDSIDSSTGQPRRTIVYDKMNRTVSIFDGVNVNPMQFTYDNVYLTGVTDPKGQAFHTSYNALGWVTSQKAPSGDSTVNRYSLDGEIRSYTNRRGQAIAFGYDAVHRKTSKSGTNTPSESWQYSLDGRIITAVSPATTETIYEDLNQQPDSIKTTFLGVGSAFLRAYRYDSSGNLDTVVITGGGLTFQRRTYTYDSGRGILRTIQLGSSTTVINPNSDLIPQNVVFPGGDTVVSAWTSVHGVTDIVTNASYYPTIERHLSYDGIGHIRTQTPCCGMSGHLGNRYTYDGLGRFVADSVIQQTTTMPPSCSDPDIGNRCINWINTYWTPTGQGWAYTYDAANNRTDLNAAYTPGTNRITAFNGCTYTTDVDGNVLTRSGCLGQTVSLRWQAEDRLDSINVNGTAIKLYYDALGRLVRKDVGGTPSSLFLWDNMNLLAELNGTGTALKAEYSYYPSLDHLHALIVSGAAYYAHIDGLSNVIDLTDAAKNGRRSYTYDDWGQLTGGIDLQGFNGVDRARWKGALWLGPELELYFMRNRWYEPFSGRFLSEDPLGLRGGLNPYVFADDDPIDKADPDGLRCHDETKPSCGGSFIWGYFAGINSLGYSEPDPLGDFGSYIASVKSFANGVKFFGYGATAVIIDGKSYEGGTYCTMKGCGIYYQKGSDFVGLGLGVFGEMGFSTSLDAFSGFSEGVCASGLDIGVCVSRNDYGMTISWSGGIGWPGASAYHYTSFTTLVTQPSRLLQAILIFLGCPDGPGNPMCWAATPPY